MPSMGVVVVIRHDMTGMCSWLSVAFVVMHIIRRSMSLAAPVTAPMIVVAAFSVASMAAVCVVIGRGGGMARTFVAPMLMGIGCRRLRAHAAQRCLEVALGIDQEVGPRDHGLSLAQPFKHFKKAVCQSAGEQFARLEATLTQGDQCDLPSAAVDHRRVGNREHGCALPSSQLGSAKHGRLEQAVGIGQLDTNLYSAGLRREIGVDEGHLASEMAAWIGAR